MHRKYWVNVIYYKDIQTDSDQQDRLGDNYHIQIGSLRIYAVEIKLEGRVGESVFSGITPMEISLLS